jgi:putative membrane protein
MSFTIEAGDRAFRDAIAAIESTSAVEVVVAVRAYARRWMVQHVIVALIAAIAVDIYAVASGWPAWAVLALPLATGLASALVVEYVPPLYRFLVPAFVREGHVIEAARALFVARGIHATRGRTGMLVFVAVRARACEIVGDVAVVEHVGAARLDDLAAKLGAAIPGGAEATAKVLASFAPELAAALPRQAGDANELPDAPIAVSPD